MSHYANLFNVTKSYCHLSFDISAVFHYHHCVCRFLCVFDRAEDQIVQFVLFGAASSNERIQFDIFGDDGVPIDAPDVFEFPQFNTHGFEERKGVGDSLYKSIYIFIIRINFHCNFSVKCRIFSDNGSYECSQHHI